MTWFKVDDGLPEHPKLESLEHDPERYMAAVTVWTIMGADCARKNTDGKVTRARLRKVLHCLGEMAITGADALVSVGLWETDGDGYRFSDESSYRFAEDARPRMPPHLRLAIAERDSWLCGLCGGSIEIPSDLHIDHIKPLSLGGKHASGNLQATHAACNLSKGNRIVVARDSHATRVDVASDSAATFTRVANHLRDTDGATQ